MRICKDGESGTAITESGTAITANDKVGENSYTYGVPNEYGMVGVTTRKILNSSKVRKAVQNELSVGDINNGNIYHSEQNKKRTALRLTGPLSDKVVTRDCETKSYIFLSGLGGIMDLLVDPDGYLYFSTIGKPNSSEISNSMHGSIYKVPELGIRNIMA